MAHTIDNPTLNPKVELGKETKKQILEALTKIRSQISVAARRQATAGDVAAEFLAGGGGLAGAASEALAFKAEKAKTAFKKKFDPLNIVHRLTGGSKLATVLAGKAMGRSEKSIRTAAGLQPIETPTPFSEAPQSSPSQVATEEQTPLLEKMTVSLEKILTKLTDMHIVMAKDEKDDEEDTELARQQAFALEQIHDEAVLEKAKSQRPKRVSEKGKEIEKKVEEEGWFQKIIGGILKDPKLLLLMVALGTAAVLIYQNFEKLKNIFGFLGDSIKDFWQSVKNGFSTIGTYITETIESIYDRILDAGESMIESFMELLPWSKKKTDAEKHNELVEKAKGTGSEARRAKKKLGKETSTPESLKAAIDKIAPTSKEGLFKTDIPQGKLSAEAQELRKGSYIEDAAGALKDGKPIAGSPERVAVGGALTQMAYKTYGELFKDEQGNPLSPRTDKGEGRDQRLREVLQQSSMKLADVISPSASAAPAATTSIPQQMSSAVPSVPQTLASNMTTPPTELPSPITETGQALSQANDMQRNAANMSPASVSSNPTVINNITNNTRNASTIHQSMPSPRSGETSYQRSQDRGYAPA